MNHPIDGFGAASSGCELRRRPYVNPFRVLLIGIVIYALISSTGFVVTWNIGPLTTSMALAAVRRRLSVEDTLRKVDRYGLFRHQVAAKKQQLASHEARERFHNRLAAFAQPLSFANVALLAGMFIYVLNTAVMSAVQGAGAAIALALA